jgi:hypothetical protein
MVGEISRQFSPTKFHISLLGSLASCGRGGTWRRKLEGSKLGEGGIQGCTISLQAAVHPRIMPRALVAKKECLHQRFCRRDIHSAMSRIRVMPSRNNVSIIAGK